MGAQVVGRAFARALRQEYAGMTHEHHSIKSFFLFSDYVIVNLIHQVLHVDTFNAHHPDMPKR